MLIKNYYNPKILKSFKMDLFDYKKTLYEQYLQSILTVNSGKLVEESLKCDNGNILVYDKVYISNRENIYLVGFGKAIHEMVYQCEKILRNNLKRGVICIPTGVQETFRNKRDISLSSNSVIEIYEGAKNNLPDENSAKGTEAIIELVGSLNHETDALIVLITGGGSSLFCKPKPGITLPEKVKVIKLLTSAGADISELNRVRKKLSVVKGGGLASMCYPVTTLCLILSDVINDPLDEIASGPTAPNTDCDKTAFNILKKYDLLNKIPKSVLEEIQTASPEKCSDECFAHIHNFLIGNNMKALEAAKEFIKSLNFEAIILSNKVHGNVENIAEFYTNMLFEVLHCLNNKDVVLSKKNLQRNSCFFIEDNFADGFNFLLKNFTDLKKICIIAGGEVTVILKGHGCGGRNQELALLLSKKVHELNQNYPHLFEKFDVGFLIAGTDGIDGPTDAAGAIGGAEVIKIAKSVNINVDEFLANNDSYNFFKLIDNGSFLVQPGHTGTNVMDIHSFVIYEKSIQENKK